MDPARDPGRIPEWVERGGPGRRAPPHSGDSANGAASAPAAAYMAAHAARPAAWCEGIAAKAFEAAYLVVQLIVRPIDPKIIL